MVITAVQNMPVIWNGNKLIQQFLNVLGGTLYPLALALLLPVYMYSIVQEKEDKLIQIMKMNGLQMWKYWVNHFLFDMVLFYVMVFIFCVFGILILQQTYFKETNFFLQIIVYTGWGIG
jgi:hypothetical protein